MNMDVPYSGNGNSHQREDYRMREIENDEALRQLMQEYVRFGLSEVARHIACNRLHHLDQRCLPLAVDCA